MKLKGIDFKHEKGRLSKIVIDVNKAQTDVNSVELLHLLIAAHNKPDDGSDLFENNQPEEWETDIAGIDYNRVFPKMTVEEFENQCIAASKEKGGISAEDLFKKMDKIQKKWEQEEK